MNISAMLSEDLVVAKLRSGSKRDVLDEMTQALCRVHREIDPARLLAVLEEREKLGSTAIGGGIAIPHGKLPGLDHVLVAFGRSPEGVDFDSVDGGPTRLLFLLVAPEDSSGMHLKALARISRLLKEQEVRERLLACEDRRDLFRAICDEDAKY